VLAKLLPVALVLALGGPARADKRDWVGSATCGSCHPRELAAWQTTRHALTRDRFAGKPEGRCLACHATGEAPAGPAIAVEVGCEACHGAGAAYATEDLMRNPAAATALGLMSDRAVCKTCHARATSSRPFDPKAPVHPVKSS
jgi:hypothetical protein